MQTDGEKMKGKKFNNILWVVFLVTGLLLIPGSAAVSRAFSKDVDMFLFMFGLFCGEFLLILSLASWRIAKGKAKSNNLFRALTPAQIVLAVSLFSLNIGMLSQYTYWLFLPGMLGFQAAIIIAIVSAIINHNRKQSSQAGNTSDAAYSSRNAQSMTTVRKTPPAATAQSSTAAKPYASPAPVNVVYRPIVPRPQPAPARQVKLPPKPEVVSCKSCGMKMKNDSSVSRLGDKYYCDKCYCDMLVRYYEKNGEAKKGKIVLLIRELKRLQEYKRRKIFEKQLVTALSNLAYYREQQRKCSDIRCERCGREVLNDELVIYNDMMLCQDCLTELKK